MSTAAPLLRSLASRRGSGAAKTLDVRRQLLVRKFNSCGTPRVRGTRGALPFVFAGPNGVAVRSPEAESAFSIIARNERGVLKTIGSVVAMAGYNIRSINAVTDPLDDALSRVTIVVDSFTDRSRDIVGNVDDDAVAAAADDDDDAWRRVFFGNNIIPGTMEDELHAVDNDSPEVRVERTMTLDQLLNAIGWIPEVVEVVPVVLSSPVLREEAAAEEKWKMTKETKETKKKAATAKRMIKQDHEDDISAAAAAAAAAPDTGLLYLLHDFASAPSWRFTVHYDALPRDPYVRDIGVGRFREYSKYRFVFPKESGKVEVHTDSDSDLDSEQGDEAPDGCGGAGFYVPIEHLTVDAAPGAVGVLLEIPDEKFNQPPGYTFSGRPSANGEKARYQTSDRRFRRLSPGLVALPEFAEIIRRFAAHARLDPRYARRTHLDLGVHAIRIVADESGANAEREVMRGQIVPEGMHRDGFQYVCLACTGRSNVLDWNAYVYAAGPGGSRPAEGAEPLFSHPLAPGEAIFLDDTRVWHDADDVRQADLNEPGYVDFIVITLARVERDE